MMLRAALLSILAAFLISSSAMAGPVPAAVTRDPPADHQHPARMEVIHVPSGEVAINGVVYVAAGPGPHPTFVFFHGLPGNEKSLDLAQAVRRAGWNAVTVNYRGSWGSPGHFSFAQNLDDAKATLAYLRDPANATKLSVDPSRLVIAGHSMGGWVALETAAQESGLLGAIAISAWDIGSFCDPARNDRAKVLAFMADDQETLAGTSPDAMADEGIAHRDAWRFPPLAAGLRQTRLLLLSSDDGLTPDATALVAAIHAAGGTSVLQRVVHTDHVWSDHRIALAGAVISWLNGLPGAPFAK